MLRPEHWIDVSPQLQGAAAEHAWSGVHVLVLNLVYARVPYFSITVYLIDTMVVI